MTLYFCLFNLLAMTLEAVLGFGAYCHQGHGLLFPLVLRSLSKKGDIFLLGRAGVGVNRGTQ